MSSPEERRYFRVMAGAGNAHIKDFMDGNFIGVDFAVPFDLAPYLLDEWPKFRDKFTPEYRSLFPNKNKAAAVSAVSTIWKVCSAYAIGDVILTPTGENNYAIGQIVGPYEYSPGNSVPHRRPVTWRKSKLQKEVMSIGLKNSISGPGTAVDATPHRLEIESLIDPDNLPTQASQTQTNPQNAGFNITLEKLLEGFLVQNWERTSLAANYDIFGDEGELVGVQYDTGEVGKMDILAISKDKGEFLVIELKKDQVSDVTIGQVLRYMGHVHEHLAEPHQKVTGLIIGLEHDVKLRRALQVTPNVSFLRYSVDFTLTSS